MKFKKITLNANQMKEYKAQRFITRKRESRGGYVGILSATDADLDRRKPVR